jgi:hypothetical protein
MLPAARLPDWPARLVAYLAQHRCTPFAWGTQDCCQFARHGVAALRGADPAKGLRLRRYTTAKGAAAVLARLGGLAAIPARCGLTEIPLTRAGRGDVVLGEFENGPTLGLCAGEKSAFVGPGGLDFRPTLDCLRAWRT